MKLYKKEGKRYQSLTNAEIVLEAVGILRRSKGLEIQTQELEKAIFLGQGSIVEDTSNEEEDSND